MTISQAWQNICRTFWQVQTGTASDEINFCVNALWCVGIVWILVWADYKFANGAADDRRHGWKDQP